jgi:hypothetical protein
VTDNASKIAKLRPVNQTENAVRRAMALIEPIETETREIVDKYLNIARIHPNHRRSSYLALDRDTLRNQVASLQEATVGATDPRAARVLFGMMLDAIPAARNIEGASYVDALVAVVLSEPVEEWDNNEQSRIPRRGFTAPVLASAVREIWRTATFAPSIPEIMEVLRKERSRLQRGVWWGKQLIRRCEEIETHEALNARGEP